MGSFKIEEITTGAVKVPADGKPVSVSIVVRNVSSINANGVASLEQLDNASASWFAIDGDKQRLFSPNATDNFRIKISVPQGTKEGKYRFRLNVWEEKNPNEDYANGSPIELVVTPSAPPPPPPPKWLWIIVAGVVVIAAAIIMVVLIRGGNKHQLTAPGLKSKTYNEALSLVNGAGLIFSVGKAGASKDSTTWKVSAQVPDSGMPVKKHDTIKVDFSSPNLVAPVVILPADDFVFSSYPMTIGISWNAVLEASAYRLEVDSCLGIYNIKEAAEFSTIYKEALSLNSKKVLSQPASTPTKTLQRMELSKASALVAQPKLSSQGIILRYQWGSWLRKEVGTTSTSFVIKSPVRLRWRLVALDKATARESSPSGWQVIYYMKGQ